MILNLCYGLPASGKSTLLNSLNVPLLNLDYAVSKYDVISKSKNFFEKFKDEKEVAVDIMFFEHEDILFYVNSIIPFSIENIIIYDFEANFDASLENDKNRNRDTKASLSIKYFNYKPLIDNKKLPDNFSVIQKKTFIG